MFLENQQAEQTSLVRKNSSILYGLGLYAALTLTSMAGMSIGVGFALAGLLFALGPKRLWGELCREATGVHSRYYFLFSLGLTTTCAITLGVAAIFPLSYEGKHAEIHFFSKMLKAWYLFWPLLLVTGLRQLNANQRSWVLRSWFTLFVLMSLLGITQYFSGWPRPQGIPGLNARFHATAFLGHHLSLASVFVFPFFAALELCVNREGRKYVGLPRWFFVMAAILGFIVLFLSFSRMLWIGLPIGILAWVILRFSGKIKWFVVVGSVLALVIVSRLPAIQARLGDAIGVGTRQELWKANWDFFLRHPLTGTGWHLNEDTSAFYLDMLHPGASHFIGHAHNNFLDMLGGTGLLGTIAWLLWCGWVLRMSWIIWKSAEPGGVKSTRSGKTAIFGLGMLCAWIVFHLNGLTQANFWEGKVMHQLMWVVAWTLL